MGITEELNEEQRLPVYDTEGAVLVLAGAGSGKTRVLTARIGYLVEGKGVPAENILAITFTNKAAREMRERLERNVDTSRMWVCTIHSMCVKILRMYASKRGLSENFSIYSEQERAAVIKQAFTECGYQDEDGALKSIRYHVSNAKMLGLDPNAYYRRYYAEKDIDKAVKVYKKYIEHLKAYNALDFDDLLLEARALLSEDREAREFLAGRFRYIHVDEFQDTNAVQFDIIKCLASVHGNLFAVGDDDQSIYGWRGAQIENILSFEKVYPKAKVYTLQRNYRSTGAILALANASISHNERRKSKTLWTKAEEGEKPVFYEAEDEQGEAAYCVRKIFDLLQKGYRRSDFAVLMRINALTRSYEQEFTKYNIPYKIFGGFKFFERKEIKDILAYLRLISNPFDDEAFYRIINVPRRGLGDKTLQVLAEYASREDLSLFDAVLDCGKLAVTPKAREKLQAFGSLIKRCVVLSQEADVAFLTRTILEETKMREAYDGESDEAVTKRANIDEFINSVDEFARINEGATLSDYLQQITLYSDTDEMDDGDYVTIATIHAVKGLEFRSVFLVGLEDGVLPVSRAGNSKEAMEEERRLMYVAITRAREKLFLTRSASRYLYGRRENTVPSPFLQELSAELDLPKPRQTGGYGQGGYGYGQGGYGYGASSYGRQGYGASSQPKRVGSYRESYPTFGSGKPPARPASSPSVPSPAARFSAPSPSSSKRDTSVFEVGMQVSHTRFGKGIVIAMRGAGENVILKVKFETAGIKELAAALAPLTILS